MGKTIIIIILLGLVAYLYFKPMDKQPLKELAKIEETETPKQKIVVEETIKEVYR